MVAIKKNVKKHNKKHACLTPIVVLLQSGGCVFAQCGFCLFGICILFKKNHQ